MRVERLDEDRWAELRDLRLRALREDGDAFGSTLAREEGFQESHWRMRLRSSLWFVARTADRTPAGIVSTLLEPGAAADDRHVMALWVAREDRRAGAGSALLHAVLAWAADDGAATVSLWAVRGNDVAAALLHRCGFTPTGTTMALARDPSRIEERWVAEVVARPTPG